MCGDCNSGRAVPVDEGDAGEIGEGDGDGDNNDDPQSNNHHGATDNRYHDDRAYDHL